LAREAFGPMACSGLGTYPEFHRECFGRIRSSGIHTGWIIASNFNYRRLSYFVMSSCSFCAQPLMNDTISCFACCEWAREKSRKVLVFMKICKSSISYGEEDETMEKVENMMPEKEAVEQIRRALRRMALIYHSFASILIEELGRNRGEEIIKKAVETYGTRIGQEARKEAQEKGWEPTPDKFKSDLPDLAWESEEVEIDGEKRTRVYHCPLAAEWLEWGDSKLARLYCFVDQAKMQGYNPDYEYIHLKNLLDGDPYCELMVRPKVKEKTKQKENSSGEAEKETVKWVYGNYTRDDLMRMDPVCLRALFRERIHHTIEVDIYPILLGEKKINPHFGKQPELILDVWKKRGFPDSDPDFEWGKKYIALARQLREKKSVHIDESLPQPFTSEEMEIVRKLIWERRSLRNWIPGKDIPDEKIEKILEAGRAAPTGCNLDIVRFVVIREPIKAKMVWSDIPTPMDRCVLIVVCYDKRVYETVGHDRLIPHNQLHDCAAAADHMCLMAHALGLGAVWLTRTEKTSRTFKEKYGLPDYIEPALHIAVGWPAIGTIKSARMPLSEMKIKDRGSFRE
jgi:nitroreductase